MIFPISSIMIESVNTEVSSDAVTRASIFAALADPGRLAIVDRLLLGDASPTEIQLLLSMPSNLVAHHVRLLEKAGVVREVRSEGDRRRKYLCVDTDALEMMVPRWPAKHTGWCSSAPRILRGVNWLPRSGIAAAPCPLHRQGTHPVAEVHPGTLAVARRHNLPMEPRTPRHLNDVTFPRRSDHRGLRQRPRGNAAQACHACTGRYPIRHATSLPDAFDRAFDELSKRINYLAPRLQPA